MTTKPSDVLADPILDPFRAKMRESLVKYLVGRQITCIRTGQVLDFRTCVVLNDKDGDPSMVMSQKGWAEVVAEGGDVKLREKGLLFVDESTVDKGKPMPAVGDFFASSGGYDQTNVHFYRVTRVTKKSVWLQPWTQRLSDGEGTGGGPVEYVSPGSSPVMVADPTDERQHSADYWVRQECRKVEAPSSMHRFDPERGYARMSSYEIAQPVAADCRMYQTGAGWGH